MPFTANKGLSVQTAGSNPGTWGAGSSDALNEGVIELLDDILGGVQSTALSSTPVTLTAAQGLNLIQRFTGTLTANVTVTNPNVGFNVYENATTGNFNVTVQYTGGVGGTIVVPQGSVVLVIADGTNGLRDAANFAANVARIFQRSANDTSEYEIMSFRSGNGGGNKGSVRIVGDGSNAVGQIRVYIGSSELFRLAASANIQVSPSGYVDLTEIAAPSSPSADVARLFPWDDSGETILRYLRSDGSDIRRRAASQAEEVAASALNVMKTPGRQHYHPGHPKFTAMATVSAGTPTLQSSYNVAGITDTATGRLTVTIATDFSSANWCCLATVEDRTGGSGGSNGVLVSHIGNGGIAAGSVLVESWDTGHAEGGTLADPNSWHVSGLGAQ